MFFEPSQVPDTLPIGTTGDVRHLGFKAPPGGNVGSPHHVLNDHTYCCQVNAHLCSATGEPTAADKERCLAWHEKKLGTRKQDADKLGVPMFISEFGACLDTEECITEINQVGDVSDQHMIGWSYWQFKTYADLTTSAGTGSEGFYNKDGSI